MPSIKDQLLGAVGKLLNRKVEGAGLFGDFLNALPTKLLDGITSKAETAFTAGVTAGLSGSGVERWKGVGVQALTMSGFPASLWPVMARRMKQESGGNPRAINDWDINAKRGTPSKGLMQVIDPTFRAYAHPSYARDIWDPLSNILASIRYTKARYGSLEKGWNGRG